MVPALPTTLLNPPKAYGIAIDIAIIPIGPSFLFTTATPFITPLATLAIPLAIPLVILLIGLLIVLFTLLNIFFTLPILFP